MKKLFSSIMIGCIAAGMTGVFSGCTSEETPISNETGSFELVLGFKAPGASRADNPTVSTAIPTTSWDNIKQVQLFLYDGNGVIRWAKTLEGSVFANLDGTFKEKYTDVPIGQFTLVAVANANSSLTNVRTAYGKNGMTNTLQDLSFTDNNIVNTNVDELFLMHAWSAGQKFPSFYQDRLDYAVVNSGRPNEYGRKEAAEIFRATSDGVTISSTQEAFATLKLSRDVAMMRVRINPENLIAADIDNGNAGLVDWTKNSAIFISNIPQAIKMAMHTDSYGITASPFNGNSIQSSVVCVYDENGTFYTEEPTTGYEGGKIMYDGYSLWRDVIVFPNYADDNAGEMAHERHQYVITISALGKAGHKCADGTILTEDATVYWSAKIPESFISNQIRELNISFKNGGVTPLPDRPDVSSQGLNIEMSLAPWDSNIKQSNIVFE